jgi:hypothetical protein
MQNYRNAMNFKNIDALSYNDAQARDELAETLDLDISGLSDAMMDSLRGMVIY